MSKKKWIPKKIHDKTNVRALTESEITTREFNTCERKQRLQERDQLVINMTLDSSITVEIPQFGSRDVVVVIGQQNEILIIKATPSFLKKLVVRTTSSPDSLSAFQKKDPFVLSVSTVPALLQTNTRPKRARGATLNYKAMHEGKQNQPKRAK